MICLSFKTDWQCPKLKARKTWQQLFDIYRQNGGSLDNMGNILIDLNALTHYFEKYENFTIYWDFWREVTNIKGFCFPHAEENCYCIQYDVEELTLKITKV
jgi:hypothetical protein